MENISLTKLIYVTGYAAAAKSLQSCPTLCDPMDCCLPGSSTHGIFQARVLELYKAEVLLGQGINTQPVEEIDEVIIQ